jgi:hypothetical protein
VLRITGKPGGFDARLDAVGICCDFTSRLAAEKRWTSGQRLPHFEILIRTFTLAGAAQEPEIIASRVLDR